MRYSASFLQRLAATDFIAYPINSSLLLSLEFSLSNVAIQHLEPPQGAKQ